MYRFNLQGLPNSPPFSPSAQIDLAASFLTRPGKTNKNKQTHSALFLQTCCSFRFPSVISNLKGLSLFLPACLCDSLFVCVGVCMFVRRVGNKQIDTRYELTKESAALWLNVWLCNQALQRIRQKYSHRKDRLEACQAFFCASKQYSLWYLKPIATGEITTQFRRELSSNATFSFRIFFWHDGLFVPGSFLFLPFSFLSPWKSFGARPHELIKCLF